jgi:hypothetical protein
MLPAQSTKLAGINIGTGAADVPNNTQLNTRLGTTGNLGTSAQQNANAVAITGGNASGLSALGVNGDITIVGANRKLIGDVLVQTGTANAVTSFSTAPNGTASVSALRVYGASDINNASSLALIARNGLQTAIESTKSGSGAYLPLIFSTSGQQTITVETNGNTGFGVNSPDTSSRIQSSNGIKLGNTANANPLVFDWYEEGEFTLSVVGSATAGAPSSYTSRVGNFTRMGRMVFIEGSFGYVGHTGTGNFVITGLPYTPGTRFSGSIGYVNGLTTAGATQALCHGDPGVPAISFHAFNYPTGAVSPQALPAALDFMKFNALYII